MSPVNVFSSPSDCLLAELIDMLQRGFIHAPNKETQRSWSSDTSVPSIYVARWPSSAPHPGGSHCRSPVSTLIHTPGPEAAFQHQVAQNDLPKRGF